MPVHANSLANLQAPFTGPDDPRRAIGRSLGASYIEWCNRLELKTDKELKTIRADNAEPRSKRLAAATLIRASRMDFAKNGSPIADKDLDRLLDRTHGKSLQRVEVRQEEAVDPSVIRLKLLELLGEHPELRQALAGRLESGNDVAGISDLSAAPTAPPGAPQGGPDTTG